MNFSTAFKQVFRFSVPIVSARWVSIANNFIAMLLIAKLGHQALAAGALIASTQTTLNVIGWSIIFSIAVVVSRVFGEGKYEDIGQVVRHGWLLGTLIGLPLMFVFWHVGTILIWFHQPLHLVSLVTPYFHVLSFSVLPGMWYVCFLQLVTGISRPRIVLYISVLSLFLMVVPGYGLLFGKLGFPKLGMIGMAYVNTFMYWVTFLIGIFYLLLNPSYKKFKIFHFRGMKNFYYFKQLLSIGFPVSMQFVAELTAFAFATMMMGWLGEASLAARQIVLQFGYLIMMGPYGVGQATSILVGQAVGRHDLPATKYFGQAGIVLGCCITGLVCMVYYIFPKSLIGLYHVNIHDPQFNVTVHIATMLLMVAGISQIFDGVRNVTISALRGFYDTKIPMAIGFVASWGIAIPLGYMFAFVFHFGAPGVRAGFLIAWVLSSVLLLRRFFRMAGLVAIAK